MKAVNYFINQEQGVDEYRNRDDFLKKDFGLDPKASFEDVEIEVKDIIEHYTKIINSSGTLLYYLCFEISIGITKRKTGYALDPLWAKGVYEAAKVDFKVYMRLAEVVGTNLSLNRRLPRQLEIFAGELISQKFPIPKKNGPAVTRAKLRNLCIFECLMLLCDERKIQISSDAKVPVLQAKDVINSAFSHVKYNDPKLPKPTSGVVERMWKNTNRAQWRYEVSMLRWLESKEKSNRWYKWFAFMYWLNRNM